MHAQLDDLLTATYALIDDFLPPRHGPGRPPKISDAELVTLAIAQILMGLPNDRQFLALAGYRLSHPFPYRPKQPGYNKRLRKLVPEIARAINYLAFSSPGFCDELRLLDSTPVPCAASRETTRRSEFAGFASYRSCQATRATSGVFRLHLLCASNGTPIAFELAPANAPEREVARETLEASRSPARPRSPRRGSRGRSSRPGSPPAAPPSSPRPKDERLASVRSAGSASGSSRPSPPARASSGSSATAPASCRGFARGSGCVCSPSPPAYGTTPRSGGRTGLRRLRRLIWNQSSEMEQDVTWASRVFVSTSRLLSNSDGRGCDGGSDSRFAARDRMKPSGAASSSVAGRGERRRIDASRFLLVVGLISCPQPDGLRRSLRSGGAFGEGWVGRGSPDEARRLASAGDDDLLRGLAGPAIRRQRERSLSWARQARRRPPPPGRRWGERP